MNETTNDTYKEMFFWILTFIKYQQFTLTGVREHVDWHGSTQFERIS